MKTSVVNVLDCPTDWYMDLSYVYVGRPSPYGNKHRIGPCFVCNRDHDRYEAVRLHAKETRLKYTADAAFKSLVEELRGKTLVCHCKRPGVVEVPCHADVYVELLEVT